MTSTGLPVPAILLRLGDRTALAWLGDLILQLELWRNPDPYRHPRTARFEGLKAFSAADSGFFLRPA